MSISFLHSNVIWVFCPHVKSARQTALQRTLVVAGGRSLIASSSLSLVIASSEPVVSMASTMVDDSTDVADAAAADASATAMDIGDRMLTGIEVESDVSATRNLRIARVSGLLGGPRLRVHLTRVSNSSRLLCITGMITDLDEPARILFHDVKGDVSTVCGGGSILAHVVARLQELGEA